MDVRSCCDGAMPRPRPPRVVRETTRHGLVVWYVRVGHGGRIRLPVGPGDPGFDEAYRAAMEGRHPVQSRRGPASGSLEWLIERYRDTGDWRVLAAETRKQRGGIFKAMIETAGAVPFVRITRAHIEQGRDRRASTPSASQHYLDAVKGLFRWATAAGFVTTDPTDGVKRLKTRKGEGFAVWTAEDVARFEKHWPLGTRARIAFDVLRYTGLRRGDAARLGRPHVRDGVISIRTEKTDTWVTIILVPPLAASLAAGPTGGLTFIATETGRPMTKESFGNLFREWATAAGVKKSAHGLRKLAATTLAEAGATVAELESVFGWSGGGMASLYTRSADRKRLGLAASAKLAGTGGEQPIPAPRGKVRDATE